MVGDAGKEGADEVVGVHAEGLEKLILTHQDLLEEETRQIPLVVSLIAQLTI